VKGRALLLAALVAGAVWVVVLVTSDGGDSGDGATPPSDRPDRLVDATPGSLEWVEVAATGSGRRARLEVDGQGELTVAEGSETDPERLRQLRDDLTPLLAVRLLPDARPEFGLEEPRLRVTLSAAGRVTRLAVGAPNFDETAVYVSTGGRTALILPRVVETLAATVAGP
jgi:hypothetical protein